MLQKQALALRCTDNETKNAETFVTMLMSDEQWFHHKISDSGRKPTDGMVKIKLDETIFGEILYGKLFSKIMGVC